MNLSEEFIMRDLITMEQILKRKQLKRPLRRVEKKLMSMFYKPFVEWYTSRETTYKYTDLYIKVKPGVFHPGFFYSTEFMLEFFEFINFNRKNVLEIGSASGLISIVAAKGGGFVTAIDINPVAIENTRINVDSNLSKIEQGGGKIDIIESDLFDNLNNKIFDLLIVNPPFYKNKVKTLAEHAWNAGENMEYFEKLFSKCKDHMNNESEMYMVLSEDCDFEKIFLIAKLNRIEIKTVAVKHFVTESLYIFKMNISL